MSLSHSRIALAFAILFGVAIPAGGQEPIRFARMPDISPDGKLVAFSYYGDIWVVEAIGGVARPVTAHEAHDTRPAFSPDGRSIAFSSNRHGGYDVFVVPVHGGRPRRLTFDSGNDLVNGWSPDGQRILFSSQRGTGFPSVSELYTVPVQGGREQRVSAFEGRDGTFSPRGDRIAYASGPGLWYRKGYRGSANDDIWIANADGGNNRRVTDFNGQDGSPMWSPDGQTLYYVSDQFGVSNLCRQRVGGGGPTPMPGLAAKALSSAHLAGTGAAPSDIVTAVLIGRLTALPVPAPNGHQFPLEPVTTHKDESVRRARISANGQWIVYECGADLWVCNTQGTASPRKLAIEAYADDKTNPERTVTFSNDISEYAVAPNEQFVACVVHGEIFLMPINGGKAKRLTEHPGNDHDIFWSPDMKKLLFISDRGGEEDIYVLEHNDPEHPELTKAHAYKVTQLTKTSEPEGGVSFSPNGRLVAFFRGGKLWTMKPDGSEQKELIGEPQVIEYDWSPDSKWIVYSRMDGMFASELYIIPVGGGESKNVTRYATRNFGISWSSDGKKLAFISQRRQDLDVFVMSMQKPAIEGDAARSPLGLLGAKDPGIDFDDIHLRVDRVTSMSSDESEVALKPDGSQVAFRSNAMNGDDLWLAASNGSQITRLTSGSVRPNQIRWSKSGNTLYFLDGAGSLRWVRPGFAGFPSAEATPPGRIPFTAKMKIDRDAEYAQMFDEGWRKLSHRFYDVTLHGANWLAVRLKYRPLVKHVKMHEDFYDLASLMLGELNASHLGVGGRSRSPDEQTAELGLICDESHRGPGLKIAEILRRGPADRRGLNLKAGEYVMAINGKELTDGVNLSQLLNDKAGETVLLQVATDPRDPKRRKVEIRAVSRQAVADLMYHRWVANNAKRVHELSGGKLGYIHIKAMDSESLDEFVRTLYSDNFDKEAIVLDVRYNGGGFTHDQVLNYLGGREHTFFVTREGAKGPVLRANDRKWTRPLVLLCNNRSYSDAEIFPSAFRSLGLGKLVGMPTGGYVIGTVNERLIDGSFFRVPRLGVFTAGGANMEKGGVIPDVVVDLHPDQLAKGQDAQLDKAVQVLTKDVEVWKKTQKPAVAAGTPTAKGPQPAKAPETPAAPGTK